MLRCVWEIERTLAVSPYQRLSRGTSCQLFASLALTMRFYSIRVQNSSAHNRIWRLRHFNGIKLPRRYINLDYRS